jgi:hypothetical protein
LDKRGGTVERIKTVAGDETLEFKVDGKTIRIVTRPSDGDGLARLFELAESPTWDDSSPLTREDVVVVVRALIERADKKGEQAEVIGVPITAAQAFPGDPRVSVYPIDPMSFSLPGSPFGLVLQMDDRGNGRLWALGETRVELGSEGMWWLVSRLVEALEDPATASSWPRFLTVGTRIGGPATQASLECGDWGVGIVWRELDNGAVGDVVAVQELTYERVDGWLRILRPIQEDLERRRAHRQRLKPARTADKWARALERSAI